MNLKLLAGVSAGALLMAGTALAQQTLTAVHAFAPTLVYTQSFLRFVDAVNERGAGVIQIEVRGGPEAIGPFQQADAVRDGVVDMAYLPGSFYGGALPEKDALVTSNRLAAEARANGGIDLINQIHQDKMGVYYLGWFDSGVCYNIFTVEPPVFNAAGDLDMSGTRLRGNAVYNAFFNNTLGAQVIDLPTGEVYAALERGVVNATGWTQIGLIDLRWNDFVRYRIAPCFFSTDLGVIVNLESWNALTPEAQAILQEVAIAHEVSSAEAHQARRDSDFAQLDAAGMTEVSLEGEAAARYLRGARESTWARMRGLMAEQAGGDANFDRLIELFYDLERAGG